MGARQSPVARRVSCRVVGLGGSCAGPGSAGRPPCPAASATRARRRRHRPGPRSGRTAPRSSQLPSGTGGGRGAGRSLCAGPRDACRFTRLGIRVRKPPLFGVRLSPAPVRGPIRAGLPVGHPARSDASVAPVRLATIDRVPVPVRGRPSTPRAPVCALPHRAARTDGRALRGPCRGRNPYAEMIGG